MKFMASIRNRCASFALLVLAALFAVVPAHAQTDMTGVTESVSTIVTAATAIGIGVLLFVLGRKVLRKLI